MFKEEESEISLSKASTEVKIQSRNIQTVSVFVIQCGDNLAGVLISGTTYPVKDYLEQIGVDKWVSLPFLTGQYLDKVM